MFLFVVPVYNDWSRLQRLVISFHAIKESDNVLGLLVVDNNSTDPRPDWLDDRSYKFDLLFCDKKGSYSARNYALRQQGSELLSYIAFTDSDCLIDPKYVISVSEFYRRPENNNVLMAGAVELFPEKPGRESIFESYDCILGLPQRNYVSRGYAVTANLVVPKAVFEAIGVFDDSQFSGGDAELCRRAIKAGFELKYNASAIVRHPARNSFEEFRKKINRVTGAQIGRTGLKGRFFIFGSILALPVLAWRRIIFSKKSLRLRWKTVLE